MVTMKSLKPFNVCRIDFPVRDEGKTGYCGISRQITISFVTESGATRSFIVAVYGAFCAYGLYGPENNGILILDDDRSGVLLDKHLSRTTGYHGPSDDQVKEWGRIIRMNWNDFRVFVKEHSRGRYKI